MPDERWSEKRLREEVRRIVAGVYASHINRSVIHFAANIGLTDPVVLGCRVVDGFGTLFRTPSLSVSTDVGIS